MVVVPWDYDSACKPLAWGKSAQWVTPGTRGFYIATLRAPEHWVDERPTFDLHNPGGFPYTGTARILEMGRDDTLASLLSPDQVFDFYQSLPTPAEIAREKSEALGSLRAWVRAHPDLATRPPVEMLLYYVLGAVDRAELKETDHPVLGTWRFTLHVPGDSSYTFYARTESHPETRWKPSRTRTETVMGDLRLRPAEGYSFLVAASKRIEDLPEIVRARNFRQAVLYALAHADSTVKGTTHWRGWLESSLLQAAAPGDPRVQNAAREASERFSSRYRQDLPDETPAQFTRGADGVLRVHQSFPVSGGADLILKGEQVSRKVIQTTW